MIADHLANPTLSVTASSVVARIQDQTEATGWGKKLEQLHGEAAVCIGWNFTELSSALLYRTISTRLGHPDHSETLFLCRQGRVQLCNGGA